MMKRSRSVAMAGIFTALATIILLLGSVFQTLDLTVAALGSLIILVAMMELGPRWAIGIYVATSILSMLLLPYKTAALLFACFGFYPVLKKPLNQIRSIVLSYVARIAVFNIFMTAALYIGLKFLNIEEDFFVFGIIVYLVANIAFVIYDFAIERFDFIYHTKLRAMFFKRR